MPAAPRRPVARILTGRRRRHGTLFSRVLASGMLGAAALLGGVVAFLSPHASAGAVASDASSVRIAFVLRTDVNRIYSIRPDGTGLRRLSSLPRGLQRGGDVKPAWSPDGRSIAFARDVPKRGVDRLSLYRMRSNGTRIKRLTADADAFDSMPSWSPDGARIAFTRATSPAASLAWIYRVRADGNEEERLSDGYVFDFSPASSPDGATMAYAHEYVGRSRSRVGIDGQLVFQREGSPRDEARGLFVSDLAWSPDGSRLAFVGVKQQLGRTCSKHLNAGRLLLGLSPARRFAPPGCIPHGDIYVVGADGATGLVRLTKSTADDRHPSWSPDGKQIVFSSGRPARLYVIPAAGGPRRLLFAPRRGQAFDPAWAPSAAR